jgi:hypothetical protein
LKLERKGVIINRKIKKEGQGNYDWPRPGCEVEIGYFPWTLL